MQALFNVNHLRAARDRAAGGYQRVSVLQQQLEQDLLQRLKLIHSPFDDILVLGAGNREVLPKLHQLYPHAKLTLVELSDDMIAVEKASLPEPLCDQAGFIQHEAFTLPLANASVDLVFSNLYFSLCDDAPALIDELIRVLKPGGCLHFSCLGPHTFKELRTAWQHADAGNHHHVIEFPDMHDVGDALVHAGFSEPVMDCEMFALTYSSPSTLLQDLRDNGVRNTFIDQTPGLTGKGRWQEFRRALARTPDSERYALTIEAVAGQAWKPKSPRQTRAADGSVSVSLESMLSHRASSG